MKTSVGIEQKSRALFLSVWLDPRAINARRALTEKKRQISGKRHQVIAFLQLDDPWSYVLSCYLPAFESRYDVDLQRRLSEALGEGYQPAPDMLAEYAIEDCRRLCRELGIPFLDIGELPPTELRQALSASLAAAWGTADFDALLDKALTAYWRGDSKTAAALCAGSTDLARMREVIAASREQLESLGHYNSAMLYYGGEWYWGVDRLNHLTDRLEKLGVARESGNSAMLTSISQVMKIALPVRPPAAAKNLPPLELFYSPRSPYSYLALQRLYSIVDAFGLKLCIRPVLPMVMRGLPVPKNKLLYVAFDAVRESRRLDVPFGKVSDPLGEGVDRFMAVFQYARSERRERDFVLNAGVGIWSEAIDIATDDGMRKITGRSGLFWPDVKQAMDNGDWRKEVEANRDAMGEAGCWGVPTVRLGNFVTWGQDRDWLLIRHLEELCEPEDGILI